MAITDMPVMMMMRSLKENAEDMAVAYNLFSSCPLQGANIETNMIFRVKKL